MSHILKAVGLKLVETLSIFLMCTADDRTAGLVADYSLNIFFVPSNFFLSSDYSIFARVACGVNLDQYRGWRLIDHFHY